MTDLQGILQKVLDAVVVMKTDGTVFDWNDRAEEVFGWSRSDAVGRPMNDLIVPRQHQGAHTEGLKRYLRSGERRVLDRRIEITALHKSGREFPVELTITEALLSDERVFIGFLRDISERKSAETALRESEAILAATYNHAFVGIAETDDRGRILRANEQFCRIVGADLEELRATDIFAITHPDDVSTDRQLFERQWRGELDNYTLEKRYVRKDSQVVWVEVAASVVRDQHAKPTYSIRIVRDVTERKDAERHQDLLLTELNHRVKNILTVVQGIAVQSFRGELIAPDVLRTFQDRLAALAKAHDLLVTQSWSPTPMRQIIEKALAPFNLEESFELHGGDVFLHPQTAITFALAIHELATNATKYGALSVPAGKVELSWAVNCDSLQIRWRERGGPRVASPTRRGFGARLLEQGLARELGGNVRLEYRAAGFECTIDAPAPAAGSPIV